MSAPGGGSRHIVDLTATKATCSQGDSDDIGQQRHGLEEFNGLYFGLWYSICCHVSTFDARKDLSSLATV